MVPIGLIFLCYSFFLVSHEASRQRAQKAIDFLQFLFPKLFFLLCLFKFNFFLFACAFSLFNIVYIFSLFVEKLCVSASMTAPNFIDFLNKIVTKAPRMDPWLAYLAVHDWVVVLGHGCKADLAAVFSLVEDHVVDSQPQINPLVNLFQELFLRQRGEQLLCTTPVRPHKRLENPDGLSPFRCSFVKLFNLVERKVIRVSVDAKFVLQDLERVSSFRRVNLLSHVVRLVLGNIVQKSEVLTTTCVLHFAFKLVDFILIIIICSSQIFLNSILVLLRNFFCEHREGEQLMVKLGIDQLFFFHFLKRFCLRLLPWFNKIF